MLDIEVLLNKAFQDALVREITADSAGQLHRARSQSLVDALARQFQQYYSNQENIRVFWTGNPENRADFRLNELLFDISVCRLAMSAAPSGGDPLPFIESGLWMVESEFARDTREALIDMSKLVLGKSEFKLFIGPRVGPMDAYLAALAEPATRCEGDLYAAIFPHPAEWSDPIDGPTVYHWAQGNWLAET